MSGIYVHKTSIEYLNDAAGKDEVYLGEWCFSHGYSSDKEIIPYQLVDYEYVGKKINYLDTVYVKVMKSLSILLNEYHGIKRDEKYYEVIFGHWLLVFLHGIYEKYENVRYVVDKYSVLHVHCLSDKQHIVSLDCSEYQRYSADNELFAEQQYADLFQHFGVDVMHRELSSPLVQKYTIKFGNDAPVRRFLQRLLMKLSVYTRKKRLVYSYTNLGYFPYIDSILSGFSRVPFEYLDSNVKVTAKQVDYGFRSVAVLNLNGDDFQEFVSQHVFKYLPISYLECFNNLRKVSLQYFKEEVDHHFFGVVGAIGSVPIFNIKIAENEKATKISYQHGGCYGSDCLHVREGLEKNIADHYITWGWSDGREGLLSNASHVLEPFRKISNKRISKSGVVVIMTAMPRFTFILQQQLMSSKYLEYLSNVSLFLGKVSWLENELSVRLSPSDYSKSWNVKSRLINENPELKFSDEKESLINDVERNRICVFGHLATTYIQSMVADRPTVIFIERDIYCHRHEAKHYFDELERVGVLHYSPIEAARHVEKIYADVETWWQSHEVQKVKDSFLSRYGRASKDWARELRSALSVITK